MDKRFHRDILRVIFMTAFFVAAAAIMGNSEFRRFVFDIHAMESALYGSRKDLGLILSAGIYILAGGGLIAIGVPRLLASAVGGIVYGAFLGSLFSLAASLLGSSILYLVGKFTLAGVIRRRIGERLETWRSRFRANAFWWVLYGRLFPFSNSTVMSLFCGSCDVPYRSYVLASAAGFTPLAVVFACYGSGGVKGDYRLIGLATALLILSMALRRIASQWSPYKNV